MTEFRFEPLIDSWILRRRAEDQAANTETKSPETEEISAEMEHENADAAHEVACEEAHKSAAVEATKAAFDVVENEFVLTYKRTYLDAFRQAYEEAYPCILATLVRDQLAEEAIPVSSCGGSFSI